jgi:hypothetical protein
MFTFTRHRNDQPKPRRRLSAKQREVRDGMALAWTTLVLCGGMSMAFNIRAVAMHTREPLALVAAIVFPVVGFLCMEKMTRSCLWGTGPWWALARYGLVGALSLAGMVVSMSHTYTVMTMWGVDRPAAIAGPLLVDIAMVVSGLALLNARRIAPATSGTAKPNQPATKNPRAKNPRPRPAAA